MKKTIFLSMLAIAINFSANAQKQNFSFSVGGGLSSISASGGNGNSATGFGVDLVGKTNLSETLEGFVQTGYSSFSENGASLSNTPFLVGVNFQAGVFKPGLGIGYSNFSGGGSSTGGFAFSPQIGYNIDKVDVVAHYTSTSLNNGSFNIIGLKVLYKISK
jgi:hypothetical protein